MSKLAKLEAQVRANQAGVSFDDLAKLCDHYFGEPRQNSGSHRVYRTPWRGNPRINIQNFKGEAKSYQVKQVIAAIDKLTEEEAS